MAKDEYKQMAQQIIAEVGKDNISNATHCMTRLRLNLKDQSLIDDEKIKAIKGVIGVNRAGEQYQIIIGQTVDKVFASFTDLTGLAVKSESENGDKPKEKLTVKSAFLKALDYLSGSMTPLIPAMITAAMFKTIQVVVGPELLDLVSADSDFYLLCGFLYSAFFYFLPIFLGFTAAKKLGASQIMGLYIGALLVVPELVQLDGQGFTVYGLIPTTIHNYSQTVIPAVLSVWVMFYVEKFFKKIIPAVLSTIFVPFLTMFIMTPLVLAVLAPLGNILGGWIGSGLIAFGGIGGFLAVAVVAALWELLVMTGMHIVLITFALTSLLTNGVDRFIMVAAILATWATFGLALGAALKIKDKEEKALTFGYVISGIVGGVTEPTIYGVMLKYKRTIVTLALGGGLAGAYAGLTHVGLYVAGASNFLSVVGYFAGGMTNIINGFVATGIAFFGTAVLTYFFGFEKESQHISPSVSEKTQTITITSPVAGNTVKLAAVEDDVFASGMMGKGIAVEPSEGAVFAPADGEISVLFPTGHAIGLTTDDGAEILIHIGMDTVTLDGQGFTTYVAVGDRVKKGQKLIDVDLEVVKKAGLSSLTPIVVSNTDAFESVVVTTEDDVLPGNFLLKLIR